MVWPLRAGGARSTARRVRTTIRLTFGQHLASHVVSVCLPAASAGAGGCNVSVLQHIHLSTLCSQPPESSRRQQGGSCDVAARPQLRAAGGADCTCKTAIQSVAELKAQTRCPLSAQQTNCVLAPWLRQRCVSLGELILLIVQRPCAPPIALPLRCHCRRCCSCRRRSLGRSPICGPFAAARRGQRADPAAPLTATPRGRLLPGDISRCTPGSVSPRGWPAAKTEDFCCCCGVPARGCPASTACH